MNANSLTHGIVGLVLAYAAAWVALLFNLIQRQADSRRLLPSLLPPADEWIHGGLDANQLTVEPRGTSHPERVMGQQCSNLESN